MSIFLFERKKKINMQNMLRVCFLIFLLIKVVFDGFFLHDFIKRQSPSLFMKDATSFIVVFSSHAESFTNCECLDT